MNIAVLAHPAAEASRLADLLVAEDLPAQAIPDLPALLARLADRPCDLLVIALDSLGGSADAALASLRSACPVGTPLLLIAELPADEDVVAALAAHDDYVVKPVRRQDLVARARVLLRRAHPDHPAWAGMVFDRFAFDARTARVKIGDRTVVLTRKEFELALLLLQHLGRPLSRTYLLETLWPDEESRASRTLDTHVSRVRSKLDLRPQNGYRLSPVYSYGYLLERTPAGMDAEARLPA